MKAFTALLGMSFVALTACTPTTKEETVEELSMNQIAVFTSADRDLEKTYNWAKAMAWLYAHEGDDPVGFWYEAALPQRQAFCMRDVSHQCVGGQVLGMAPHNKNMFMRFAENISESRDWCSYWEINKDNKPAPADYENDSSFWYNLNANFDVMQACLKLYKWTGDESYISDPTLVNFYDRTVNEYVQQWDLLPEKAFSRSRYMNKAGNFDLHKSFHTCRGLASYAEGFPGITMSLDLLSAMYAGHCAYAEMAEMNGESEKAAKSKEKAMQYKKIVDEKYWDKEQNCLHTFWTEAGEFKRGEGVPLALWFGVLDNPDRIRASVKDILGRDWNVENLSAFPYILYKEGYLDEAYRILVRLPSMKRAEYPEVSFGIVEGIVSGAMGIKPDYSKKIVSTCAKLKGKAATSAIKNLPMFGGYLSVKNEDKTTTITNKTGMNLTWQVAFMGDYAEIKVGGKTYPTNSHTDTAGNTYSTCQIPLSDGAEITASVEQSR